ncbi:alpha-mannosidase [candidate division KSB1 bacterium]|nr:alpha-mannosidase [candidate division KSB1 bacterium]
MRKNAIRIGFIFTVLFYNLVSAQNSYLRDWLVCGSFKVQAAHKGLAFPYINEDEQELYPFGGDISNGQAWMLYHSLGDDLDFLNPVFNFPYTEQCALYLHLYIQSPSQQAARLLVGSDDEIAIWLNSKLIHFNEVQRGHRFDDDTVKCTFQTGWNRLLAKVTNGAVAWGFSMRIIDASDLKIQPESPFAIPPEKRKPASVQLLQGPGKPEFAFDSENEPVCRIAFSFLNHGTEPIRDLRVSLVSGGAQYHIAENLAAAAGGEIFPYQLILSMASLDSILHATEPVEFAIENRQGARICQSHLFANRDVLNAFFSPWKLHDWQVSVKDNLQLFEKQWIVPKIFKGFDCFFAADVPDVWATCKINNKTKLEQFTGDTGELLLTKKASEGQRFQIQLAFKYDSSGTKAPSLRSSIKPGQEEIERYLFDSIYAEKLFKRKIENMDSLDLALLQSIWQGQLKRAEKICEEPEKVFKEIEPLADKYTLNMIGNAHIDMAWLWRYPETIDECKRTFNSAIENIKRYPDFKFSHGQALSYQWVEEEEPELFNEIKKYVKKGRWEIIGGTWVEPDANLPDGESHVRQYLYGKRYFNEKFDIDVVNGWMPDTFGHPATLPQILAKCGIKSYTFFRPWNDERMFYWQAPDSSRVFAHRPPRWYGSTAVDENLCNNILKAEEKFKLKDFARFYGVGDHGGGPTRRNIETIQRLDDSRVYPEVKMVGLGEYYRKIFDDNFKPLDSALVFPVVQGEQNFVFRGCWTSQARTKWNNRRSECSLVMAETFSTIGMLFKHPYLQTELTSAWQNALFNQFHDILAGSSIGPVYVDAEEIYQRVFETADGCIDNALRAIGANIDTNYPDSDVLPIVVFNSLNWARTAPVELVVRIESPNLEITIFDSTQQEIPVQIIERQGANVRFVFVPDNVPAFGYRLFWLKMIPAHAVTQSAEKDFTLENDYIFIQIDRKTGAITRFYDKRLNKILLEDDGAIFQIQRDEPDGMSAWKLGLKGPITRLDKADLVSVTEDGPVRKVITVKYQHQNSNFIKRFILYHDLPCLEVQVIADWHERNQMVKIAFPFQIEQAKATFDIPFGHIERPADGSEVPMQKWVDVSNAEYGVAILNDCKYACDVNGSTVRLSVMRGSTDPDPNADEGYHTFSYVIVPHTGDWRNGKIPRKAQCYNSRLMPLFSETHKGRYGAIFSFLRIDAENVILSALKKNEDSDRWLIRLWETDGKASQVKIVFPKFVKAAYESCMIEWNLRELRHLKHHLVFQIQPFEVKTLCVEFFE